MSEPNPSNEPLLTPEGSAKSRKIRKVLTSAIIGATVIGAVLLIIALMQHNNEAKYESGVVIRIDNLPQEAHFQMVAVPGEMPAQDGVLMGEPLGNTGLSTAREIRAYYDGLVAEKGVNGGLSGANNFVGEKGSLALFYTFYLQNTSATEDQVFRISCKLNQAPETLREGSGARAYDYLRLGLYMGDMGAADDDVRYYGAANTRFPTVDSSEEEPDYRECLSSYRTKIKDDGKTYRYPWYKDGDIGYCSPFVPGPDQTGLFDADELTIQKGASRRVTFFAYLEAEDPDSFELPSRGQSLSFSLHIGV